MGCPYFKEGYTGTCGAATSRYVPRIDRMETFCFKENYRRCPTLSEYLYENDMAMANCPPKKELPYQ